MRVIVHIFKYKLLNLTAYFRAPGIENRLKTTVGFFVVLSFFTAALYFFHYIFNYLNGLQDIGTLLMDKVMSIGLLAIFIMLTISNIATAVSTLYRSPETASLFAAPLSHLEIFTVRFVDNMLYSTWGVLLMFIVSGSVTIRRKYPAWSTRSSS